MQLEKNLKSWSKEIREAIEKNPKNKAVGIDGITTEVIQTWGESGVVWLPHIFRKAQKEIAAPVDWQRAIIVAIWKKTGNKQYWYK